MQKCRLLKSKRWFQSLTLSFNTVRKKKNKRHNDKERYINLKCYKLMWNQCQLNFWHRPKNITNDFQKTGIWICAGVGELLLNFSIFVHISFNPLHSIRIHNSLMKSSFIRVFQLKYPKKKKHDFKLFTGKNSVQSIKVRKRFFLIWPVE